MPTIENKRLLLDCNPSTQISTACLFHNNLSSTSLNNLYPYNTTIPQCKVTSIMLMILLLLQSVTVSVPSKLHPCSGSHNHPLKLPWQSSQVHSCNNLYHFLVGLDFWGFFCLTTFNLNFMKLMTWLPPFSYFYFKGICTLSKLLVRPVHLKRDTKGVEQKKIQKEKH